MFSMFTKAMIITLIIFIPMVIINAVLANSPNLELMDWTILTIGGIPLIIILLSVAAIKMTAKKS